MENTAYVQTIGIANMYMYSDKELNTDLGIEWSDFGARWYDAAVGRWWSVDPLAERFIGQSAYNFVYNTPVCLIDKDGREPVDPKDPTIAKLNTIATQLDAVMDKMWINSFLKGDNRSVEEWGATIVFDTKTKQYQAVNINTEHKSGSVNIDYENLPKGTTLVGDIHTHPYSDWEAIKGEKGPPYNSGPSDGDILRMRHPTVLRQGHVTMIQAGDRRFALVITDLAKAKAFFASNSDKKIRADYNAAFDRSKGEGKSFSQATNDATRAVLGTNNGIGFYRTDDPNMLQFITTNGGGTKFTPSKSETKSSKKEIPRA